MKPLYLGRFHGMPGHDRLLDSAQDLITAAQENRLSMALARFNPAFADKLYGLEIPLNLEQLAEFSPADLSRFVENRLAELLHDLLHNGEEGN